MPVAQPQGNRRKMLAGNQISGGGVLPPPPTEKMCPFSMPQIIPVPFHVFIVTISVLHSSPINFPSPTPFPHAPRKHSHSSVKRSKRLMLNIITSSPIVTIINNANPNQPNIIAVAPTPLFRLPLPRSCAIVLAATEAVCCHRTDTSTNTDATKMSARATWDTGREGKGLTSRSEPRSSVSSCQPGKVARRTKQTNARIIATILFTAYISYVLLVIYASHGRVWVIEGEQKSGYDLH